MSRPGVKAWELTGSVVLFIIFGLSTYSNQRVPNVAHFGGDSWEYQSIAVNFAAGKGFRFGALLPFETYRFDSADPAYYDSFMEVGATGGEPSTFRTPAYPFVLGMIYKAFGVSPRVAKTIQIVCLLVICALLPILGRGLFGRGGFLAGLTAGLVFHRMVPNLGGRILTESLITLAVFLVLVAWVVMNRQLRVKAQHATLLGITLAAAVLVKGSLIFLPPLFLGFMALQMALTRRYDTRTVVIASVAFVLPVAAYSAYASAASGSFVILSRQGPSVLLAGNNELAVETGAWSPGWSEDPESFFNRILEEDPDTSPMRMILAFYAENPLRLVRVIPLKLVAMFGTKTSILLGVFLSYFAAVTLCCRTANQLRQRVIVSICLGATLALFVGVVFIPALQTAVVMVAFGPGLVFFFLTLRNPCVRNQVAALWRSPGWVAVILVLANFVLVALVVFGDPRFFAPARFVLLMASAFMFFRMLGALALPPHQSLRLDQD